MIDVSTTPVKEVCQTFPPEIPEGPVDALPVHRRAQPTFEQILGAAPALVVARMDEAGDDPANQQPHYELPISSVGLGRQGVPVRILHPLAGDRETVVACDIDVRTTLAASRRGIHVSRMGNVLAEVTSMTHTTLEAFAALLCQRVQQTQGGGATRVSVRSRFWYREGVSGFGAKADKQSLEAVAFWAHVSRDTSGRAEVTRGLEVDHITACPCVQQTLKHSLLQRDPGLALLAEVPALTHSQRSRTSVELGSASGPTLADLLQAVDEILFRTQATLPRPQELMLVMRAHQKPQFLEDVLRDLTRRVCEICEDLPGATQLRVSSRSLESIHDFDLGGELASSLADARATRMRVQVEQAAS